MASGTDLEAATALSVLAKKEQNILKDANSSSPSVKHTSKPDFNDPETKLKMRYLQMTKEPNRAKYEQKSNRNEMTHRNENEFNQKIIHDNCNGRNVYKSRKFDRRGHKKISSRRRNQISFHNERRKTFENLVFRQGIENTLHQHVSRGNPRPGNEYRINDVYNLSEHLPPNVNGLQFHTPRRHGDIDSYPLPNSMHIGNNMRMNAPRLHREIDSSLYSNNISIRNNSRRIKSPTRYREIDSSLSKIPIDNHLLWNRQGRYPEIDSSPLSNKIPIGNNSLLLNTPRLQREIDSSPVSNRMPTDNSLLLNRLRYSEMESSPLLNRMPVDNNSLLVNTSRRHAAANDFSRLLNSMPMDNNSHRLSTSRIHQEDGSSLLLNSINPQDKIIDEYLTLNTLKRQRELEISEALYKISRNNNIINDSQQMNIPPSPALSHRISHGLDVNDGQRRIAPRRHSEFPSSGQGRSFQDTIIEDALNVLQTEKPDKELRRIQGDFRVQRDARSMMIQNWLSNSNIP